MQRISWRGKLIIAKYNRIFRRRVGKAIDWSNQMVKLCHHRYTVATTIQEKADTVQ